MDGRDPACDVCVEELVPSLVSRRIRHTRKVRRRLDPDYASAARGEGGKEDTIIRADLNDE